MSDVLLGSTEALLTSVLNLLTLAPSLCCCCSSPRLVLVCLALLSFCPFLAIHSTMDSKVINAALTHVYKSYGRFDCEAAQAFAVQCHGLLCRDFQQDDVMRIFHVFADSRSNCLTFSKFKQFLHAIAIMRYGRAHASRTC